MFRLLQLYLNSYSLALNSLQIAQLKEELKDLPDLVFYSPSKY